MPNLLNRSKHEEFESNSTLQIRNQKERKAEKKAGKSSISQKGAKISHWCEISHCAKFRTVQNLFLHFFSFGPPFDYFFLLYPSCISDIEGIIVFLLT